MSTAQRLTVSQRHSHLDYGGPKRWFNVFIHPTLDHFRSAANRYSGGAFDGAIGCCHPAPVKAEYDEATDAWVDNSDPHWAGVIRFVDGKLSTEVVAHEMVHAALVIYRMDVCTDVRLGNGCRGREETLAYITGDLIGAASTALHDAGVWQ